MGRPTTAGDRCRHRGSRASPRHGEPRSHGAVPRLGVVDEPMSAGVASLERIEALVACDELYDLAAAIPEPDRSRGGRPRLYPTYMWILFDALLSVYGSARRVEAELSHPLVWGHLRHLIARRFADD